MGQPQTMEPHRLQGPLLGPRGHLPEHFLSELLSLYEHFLSESKMPQQEPWQEPRHQPPSGLWASLEDFAAAAWPIPPLTLLRAVLSLLVTCARKHEASQSPLQGQPPVQSPERPLQAQVHLQDQPLEQLLEQQLEQLLEQPPHWLL